LNGVKETNVEKLYEVANKLIDKDKLVIVVVGEAAAVQADLEKIAPVTVIKEEAEQAKPPP
jgi:hypothetical protein